MQEVGIPDNAPHEARVDPPICKEVNHTNSRTCMFVYVYTKKSVYICKDIHTSIYIYMVTPPRIYLKTFCSSNLILSMPRL